jgi:hypothetical protein
MIALIAVSGAAGCGFVQGVREMRSLRRVAKAEETAFRAYRQGARAEATGALLDLASLLEREESWWKGTPHGKGLAFDLSLTYLRLAITSESAADAEGGRRYLQLAQRWYEVSGQPRRDVTTLRELLKRADEAGDRGEQQVGDGTR